jgi:hypothetical protein
MSINTFSKFNITTNIRKILINDNDLVELVGNKIYPIDAPDGVKGDFILYERNQYFKEYTSMGVAGEKCYVFLTIVSDDYDRSIVIVNMVNDLVEGIHQNEKNQYFECRLTDSTEVFEDKKYKQILLFKID